MCGACGASGPIASYYDGDVVRITCPEIGIDDGSIAKVMSIRNDWGIELKFQDSVVKWVSWDPFTCRVEYPKFSIVRVRSSLFVELLVPLLEDSAESSTGSDSKSSSSGEMITIGQGWLKEPCILPKKVAKP
mmetsp:Transcript_35025/g.41804  ORF Transcript_35025/g.41804 Transcript_35025/m.41804 type:complete len:132 (+) Transcript_35025:142-537(+)